MSNLNKAVTGITDESEAKRLLLSAGVDSLKARGGYVPPQTSDSLLETETQFSTRTRASRQSHWMRITKYLQFLAFKHWGMAQGLPLTAFPQIEAVIYGEREIVLADNGKLIIREATKD